MKGTNAVNLLIHKHHRGQPHLNKHKHQTRAEKKKNSGETYIDQLLNYSFNNIFFTLIQFFETTLQAV